MSRPRVIVAVVLALLVVILIVQNAEVVEVRLLFWRFELSRVVLILLAAVTGFLCGWVAARWGRSSSGPPGPAGSGDPPR